MVKFVRDLKKPRHSYMKQPLVQNTYVCKNYATVIFGLNLITFGLAENISNSPGEFWEDFQCFLASWMHQNKSLYTWGLSLKKVNIKIRMEILFYKKVSDFLQTLTYFRHWYLKKIETLLHKTLYCFPTYIYGTVGHCLASGENCQTLSCLINWVAHWLYINLYNPHWKVAKCISNLMSLDLLMYFIINLYW